MRGLNALTPAQRDFIERQVADMSSQGLTPSGLVLQATEELLQGKYQQSFDTYTEALARASDFAEAYAGRAGADSALGNHDKAFEDLTEALRYQKDATELPI